MATTLAANNDVAATTEGCAVTIDVLGNDGLPKSTVLYSLGSAAVATTSTTTARGATIKIVNGKVIYDASTSTSLDALSQGETAVDTFTYSIRATDGTMSTATVSVTVTGTNDVPLITAGPATAALAEAAGQMGSSTPLTTGGAMAFTDVDLKDTHTVSASLQALVPSVGSVPSVTASAFGSALVAKVTQDSTNTGSGTLGWTFAVADSAVDFLAAGETLKAIYVVKVSDGRGGTAQQTVSVTLTGTNDAPHIYSASIDHLPYDFLFFGGSCTSGALTFDDADLSDRHTISASLLSVSSSSAGTPSAVSTALASALHTKLLSDSTGVCTGVVDWEFSLGSTVARSLAVGQTILATYQVTVDDGHGGTAVQPLSFLVTGAGSNCDPTVVAGVSSGVLAEAAGVTGSTALDKAAGTLNFEWIDSRIVRSVASTLAFSSWSGGSAVPSAALAGVTSAFSTAAAASDCLDTSLGWTFSAADKVFDFLGAGQTMTLAFNVTVTSLFGDRASQLVTVTITGTDDAPVVMATPSVGSVTELTGTTIGNLISAGTIAFTDADLTDVHTVSAAPVGTTLGTLVATKTADTTGTGTGGAIGWTYSVADSLVEYLAAGQTKVESFTVMVNDGNGGVVTKQVDVTITGTNDAPILAAAPAVGSVTELTGTTAGNLISSGSIGFTDVDLADSHTVSASAIGTTLGTLTAIKTTDTTGSGTGGSIGWTYNVADSLVEYLAAGQTKVESFKVTLSDGNGGVVTKQIDVTITGTNDAPILSTAAATGSVTELTGTTAGTLTSVATIGFTDVDLTDVHTVSAAPAGTTLGTLVATKTADTTGSGTGGSIGWSYSVADSAVEYLAAGQTKVESFTVTLNDGNGGVVTKQVNVTVTGTNDAPLLSMAAATGSVTELTGTTAGTLTSTGTIGFTDVDLTDVHTVSASAIGTPLGTLVAVKTTDTTGTGTAGSIGWTYNVADSLVEYLAAGQSKVESFTVTLNDGNGGVVTKQIDVTVTGTNDAPIVSTAAAVGGVTELTATTAGTLTGSGSIGFTDVDLTDVHTVSASAVGTTLGTLVAIKTADTTGTGTGGAIAWTYSVADSAVEYLAAGQTKVEGFTVTLNDGNGGVVTKQVNVTVTGTNDAPILSTAAATGSVTELTGTTAGNLTSTGTIGFTDVDLTDVHTVSASAIGTTLGTLNAIKTADTTGTGTGGSIGWSYSVADIAVEYLAAGQTKVESFTVTLSDGNGGVVTKQVDVTITGTNDAPILSTAAATGSVTELTGTTAGNLTSTGTIGFTDVDLTDVHSVSASANGTTLGTLVASKTTDTTGTGTGGAIGWTYNVADSLVEYLAAGQTRVECFTVTLNDGNGGVVTKQVNVTITGTNDAPIASTAVAVGSVTELTGTTAGTLTSVGTIGFTDVDLTDVHAVSAAPVGTTLGTLVATKTTDTTGTGTGGAIGWSYSVADSAVEYLAAGQTKVECFTVTLSDGNGGVVTKQVNVTVTGTTTPRFWRPPRRSAASRN